MDMDGRGRRWTIVFSNLFRRDFEMRGVCLKGGRNWREFEGRGFNEDLCEGD